LRRWLPLAAAYFWAFDRDTSRHVRVALAGAPAHVVLPFDFVPDMMPLLGFIDDAAVLPTGNEARCPPYRSSAP